MTERSITLTVDGTEHELDIEPRTLLVHALRDELDYTGPNVGCETSMCGACTVHLDGDPVKSCTLLAVQADGAHITTIEGVASDGDLHPLQESFHEEHGLQCGYCTGGMVMTALNLLERNPDPDEAEVRHALKGNICRCTGYQNIVDSVQSAATKTGAETDGGRPPSGTEGE